ncbi:MAG: tRNA lysidine(34) synthetase TilS [Vicingaceae bacterium]|nr:tRNA lysidine(34) synthetase TilS [Vicingaceae bacterium]
MLAKFQKYYQENDLFKQTDKVLLTVSGGKDSMLMLHLFEAANLVFGVAHCNFQLRGEEANKDELFVREYCLEKNITFHSTLFETEKFAAENNISIQMAARDLRYSWFEKIRKENGYKYIGTAHHNNDVAETMLINLTKGTGLAGLHGISNKRDAIIRPLLCFDVTEIENYMKENELPFRQDESNTNTKYTRNLIRHNIIPELEKINPSLIETLTTSADQFSELEIILNQKIEEEKSRLFIEDNEGIKIRIELLKKLNPLKTYLYYLLKPFKFNITDVIDIIKGLDGESGKTYNSTTHQIIKDRTHLFLGKLEQKNIESIEMKSIKELPFDYQLLENTSDFKINKSTDFGCFDADLLGFPMQLRTWRNGDYFCPLGMKGNKKVSDFLIDNKISLAEKNCVKVLCFNNEIIWLVGHRISEKCKITSATKRILILKK